MNYRISLNSPLTLSGPHYFRYGNLNIPYAHMLPLQICKKKNLKKVSKFYPFLEKKSEPKSEEQKIRYQKLDWDHFRPHFVSHRALRVEHCFCYHFQT